MSRYYRVGDTIRMKALNIIDRWRDKEAKIVDRNNKTYRRN